MKRIRIALLLLAVALALPVAMLVGRALDSIAFERKVRHEAVSERVFDEMERALSRLLEREEARPIDEYRFYSRPGDDRAAAPVARVRSPLSRLAKEPYVIAHFQIDPDGSLRTPLRPADPARAQRVGDWPPEASEHERLRRAIATLEEQVAPFWSEARVRRRARRVEPERPPEREQPQEIAAEPKRKASAYEVLQSFNLGARQRLERRQVIAEAPRSESIAAPERAGADTAYTRAQIVLGPMAGHALDAGHLMLYRTVLIGERGYRQGLLIDTNELVRWLEDEIIASSALAGVVHLDFTPDDAAATDTQGRYVSHHDFAEPFDTLHARLALEPLRGMGSTTTIYALAGLLTLVAAAGLAAVYRMTAVVVHFAERRSNFVAAVSHELKTPLTAIRMYGEMLRDGLVPSDEKREEYHRAITDESERLSRLIDNVLEFSRLEKGRREFRLSPGSLAEAVEEISAKLRPHVERQGFALRLEITPHLPSVRFDRDALVQMLFNLIDNAVKYARDSKTREVVVCCERTGDGRIAVSVRDHGPGVPCRQLVRIFEPFFRGEQELTRTTQGSGIGLALVKEIGEGMGATVSAENPEGGGFRVSVAFGPSRARDD